MANSAGRQSHIASPSKVGHIYQSCSYRDAIFTIFMREWCIIPHLCRPFSPPQARRQGMTNPKPAMRAAQLKMVAPRQLPPPRQNNNYVQGRGRGRTQMVGGGRVSYDLLAARTTRCRFFAVFFFLFSSSSGRRCCRHLFTVLSYDTYWVYLAAYSPCKRRSAV